MLALRDTHGGFWYACFAIFPWCLLGKGLVDFGQASATEQSLGISFPERYTYCVAEPPEAPVNDRYLKTSCVMPLGDILVIYAIEYFLYFLLAVYLDNILSNENGVSRPLWYFLLPSRAPWLPHPP